MQLVFSQLSTDGRDMEETGKNFKRNERGYGRSLDLQEADHLAFHTKRCDASMLLLSKSTHLTQRSFLRRNKLELYENHAKTPTHYPKRKFQTRPKCQMGFKIKLYSLGNNARDCYSGIYIKVCDEFEKVSEKNREGYAKEFYNRVILQRVC